MQRTFYRSSSYFMLITGIFWALSCSKNLNAATWNEVSNSLKQNANEINACLTKAIEDLKNKNPAGISEFQSLSAEKLDKTEACFHPIFRDLLDRYQVELTFGNALFTQEIRLSGKFTFELTALNNDDVVTKDEIKLFNLTTGSCSIDNLSEFSYIVGQKPKTLLRLKYASSVVNEVLNQDATNSTIASLQKSLESLTSEGFWFIELRQKLLRQNNLVSGFSSYPNTNIGFNFPLDAYLLSSSSPKLKIKCGSENLQLSVVDGLADGTFIRKKESSSSGFGFQLSSGTSKITVNGQTLIIKTKQQNNQIQTTYQGLPLVVSGSI